METKPNKTDEHVHGDYLLLKHRHEHTHCKDAIFECWKTTLHYGLSKCWPTNMTRIFVELRLLLCYKQLQSCGLISSSRSFLSVRVPYFDCCVHDDSHPSNHLRYSQFPHPFCSTCISFSCCLCSSCSSLCLFLFSNSCCSLTISLKSVPFKPICSPKCFSSLVLNSKSALMLGKQALNFV